MKSFVILTAIFTLMVWVEAQVPSNFCNFIKSEEGNRAVYSCMDEHMPAFVPKVVSECYEEAFEEPGTLVQYFEKLCDLQEIHHDEMPEQFQVAFKCLRNRMEEARENAGIGDKEFSETARLTEDCWMEKVPKTNDNDNDSNELEEVIEDM